MDIYLFKNYLSCYGLIVVEGIRGEEVRDGDIDENDVPIGVQSALQKNYITLDICCLDPCKLARSFFRMI